MLSQQAKSSYEKIDLTEPEEGYKNDSAQLFCKGSNVYGLGYGLMLSITDKVDLYLCVNHEWTRKMTHLDLTKEAYNASERITTNNSVNAAFSVGFHFRMGCKDKSSNTSIPKRRTSRASKKKVVKKTNTVKT